MSKQKIILMGTSEFAIPSFEKIILDDRFEVVGLFTQPDRKKGRNQKLSPSPVKEFISSKFPQIKIYTPNRLRDAQNIELIQSLSPDLIFIISYGHILSREILNIPKFGCINLHASLLPKLRGSSPINNAILEGSEKTGVTFFILTENIDDGDIIWKEEVPLINKEDAQKLHNHLAQLGAKTCCNVLYKYINGELIGEVQDHDQSTHCKKLSREDGEIKWKFDDADYIEKQVRAYNPWPGTYTYFGKKRLKIFEVELSEDRPHKLPGTVFVTEDKRIAVRAKTKSIILKTVQLEGKQKVSIEDLIQGYPNITNNILGK